MQEMVREISKLSQQIQQDINDWCHNVNGSTGSDESIVTAPQTLTNIEKKLDDVHGHTSILVRRIPDDLGFLLDQIKRTLLLRFDELSQANQANHSHKSDGSDHAKDSVYAVIKSLTAQERQVFQLCFEAGFLSYRDLASHLDITPGAAKNLVNRIFQSDRKRPIFTKQYHHRAVRVGIRPDLEKKILVGKEDKGKKSRQIELSTSV